jgi:thiamine-phosphate pyrophosphorylase
MVEALHAAAEGGARLFQYRDKSASMKDAYRTAGALREAAAKAGAVLIINDRCDLALAVDAAGVHLGQTDLPVSHARRLLGPDRLIGLSTHTAAQVREGDASEADYLGFGPVFPPGSKADHDPVVGLDGLAAVRALTRLPIFAIGGITAASIPAIVQAGADGAAIVSAICRAPDIAAAVRECLTQIGAGGRPAR